ncbi:MAG: hypothetical protein E6Q97_36815 [Desulfurellales bacterium]|nr:MAG: hypothetical protein E6Q97_36815 [Desulfurellales bacterium]
MPARSYAVLIGGPGDNRLVLVERGKKEFLLPMEACNCGVIHYDQKQGKAIKTFTYIRTEQRVKGMPVFEFLPEEKRA